MMRGVAVQMQCWEKGPAAAQMQRELSYRCSSGSGKTMGSSTGYSSVEDGGQQYRIQQCRGWWAAAQGPMPNDQSNT